jgi:hypothetical protein
MGRSIRDGSNYLVVRGISLGCPLGPLIAAFFRHELDRRFEQKKLFYVRFMDDILILATTRWKIRAAMAAVQSALGGLRLELHHDKTFIGGTEKGFEYLGNRFHGNALGVAGRTFARMRETVARL